MSSNPIADYALLSDCHSAALVSRDGSIDWLCFPRFDGPSVFGRLLDDSAGHWFIRPAGDYKSTRRYIDGTLVLETTFTTRSGTATLVDALAMAALKRSKRLGDEAPQALLRRVTCTSGEIEIEVEYAPRPEYGLVFPLLSLVHAGVSGRGGATVLLLSSRAPFTIEESAACARFRLSAGETTTFGLQHRSTSQWSPEEWPHDAVNRRIDETVAVWQRWSKAHQRYSGPWAELVNQSGRVLQALTYFPTGAIVAAPTTSLPETVGGGRNWDYRYTWVRDASFTLDALGLAAGADEAYEFFDFLAATALTQVRRGADLQIMFGIGGEHDLTERELPHLCGWRASAPVRIGNGAWNQRQLDVYGELLDAVHRLGDGDAERRLDDITREFLADLADAAAERWQQQDHGIWEIRGAQHDYLYSKLMCWVALDRAIALADQLRAGKRVPHWRDARDEIHRTILDRGWSERVQSFTQAFGSDALDASNLMMAIVGFLPRDDHRLRATVEATAKHLTDSHGLVYRYRMPDGQRGEEGTFVLCTFWLAHAQAIIGDFAAARKTFEAAIAFVNDVGLLSEEVDAKNGELLGNFPQAFSHIGLINAAWAIATGQHRPARTSEQATKQQGGNAGATAVAAKRT